MLEEEDGIFWVHWFCRRCGVVFAALWFNWRSPVDFWDLGEGLGMLGRAGGRLEREFADGGIFRQKML